MRNVIFIFGATTMLFLAGCSDSKHPDEAKTVDYYKVHKEEREAKITKCENNLELAKKDAECANAMSAQMRSGIPIDPEKSPSVKKYQNF